MKLINANCLEVFPKLKPDSIHLTVTSPPYDGLRSYSGHGDKWCREVWQEVIQQLYRVTKPGGVVVWIVGDATKAGSETGTSFEQALYARQCGFNLHDTMIYHKANPTPVGGSNRYYQAWEYMFIWTKGKPKTFNQLTTPRRNRWGDNRTERLRNINRDTNGDFEKKLVKNNAMVKKQNVWSYVVSGGDNTADMEAHSHPAIFPEQLAADHILSWSNEGDAVLDPFMGSGTVGKMCRQLNREFIGVEIAPDYFALAKQRINKKTKPPKQPEHHGYELGYQRGSKLTGSFDTIFTDKPDSDRELKHLLDMVGHGTQITVHSMNELADSMGILVGRLRHIIGKGGSIRFTEEGHHFTTIEQVNMLQSLIQFDKKTTLRRQGSGKNKNGRPSRFTQAQMRKLVKHVKAIKTMSDREKLCADWGISIAYSYRLGKKIN